jgi:hypothetical protein
LLRLVFSPGHDENGFRWREKQRVARAARYEFHPLVSLSGVGLKDQRKLSVRFRNAGPRYSGLAFPQDPIRQEQRAERCQAQDQAGQADQPASSLAGNVGLEWVLHDYCLQ